MNVNKKSYEIVDVKDLNAFFSNNVNLDCFSFYGIVLVILSFVKQLQLLFKLSWLIWRNKVFFWNTFAFYKHLFEFDFIE
jgi:hypothetical protein